MKSLEEKLQSPTYHYTKLQNRLYSEIQNFLLNSDSMNQTKLAEKLGVTKGYVSQIMNNGADHKLSKFIKLSLAIGKIPNIEFVDYHEYYQHEMQNREARIPLDLDEMEKHFCKLDSINKIEKENHSINYLVSAKPYSEF